MPSVDGEFRLESRFNCASAISASVSAELIDIGEGRGIFVGGPLSRGRSRKDVSKRRFVLTRDPRSPDRGILFSYVTQKQM